MIDGFLTEINVTSPTGIRAIKNLGGPDVAAMIWDTSRASAVRTRVHFQRRLVKRLGFLAVLRRTGRGDGPFFCDGLFNKSR